MIIVLFYPYHLHIFYLVPGHYSPQPPDFFPEPHLIVMSDLSVINKKYVKIKCFAKSLKYNYLFEAVASVVNVPYGGIKGTQMQIKLCMSLLHFWMLFFSRKFSSTIIFDKAISNNQSTNLPM